MLKKILLPTIVLVLGYGFWISPDFKEIAAGVSIFLFGMLTLEEGFKLFSGGTLENILQKSTNKLYKSIGFGFVTTTIMQSSGLVSVLSVSFIGAGLITLTQGIGIIFGANIGTTTGAWLMAGFGLKVKISDYAMPMLVIGVLFIFQKVKSIKGIGYILAGIGFLFLGIHYMKEGFEAFKATIDLASFAVEGFKGLMIFIGIGIVATIAMQSSHATIVLVLTALAVGQITYENGLALVIGANIGTTITAVIASFGSNAEGRRLAGAHFTFNLITAIIAMAILNPMVISVDFISHMIGIAEDNYTLKLAVFDSVFKIMGVVVFIPFIGTLEKFLEKVVKSDMPKSGAVRDTPRYLNDSVLELPSIAMAAIVKETKHLYENAFEIITHGLNLHRSNILSSMPMEEVVRHTYSDSAIDIDAFYNNRIKGIYGEIIDFSTKAQSNMTPENIQTLYKIKLANRDMVEAVKDTKQLQKNLVKYSQSANAHIKAQYDLIRRDLAELLRNINMIATTEEEDVKLLLLSKIKVHTEKYDILANGTLDRLIRERLITNEMATSLMNDSAYAYDIGKNLTAMAEIIFTDAGSPAAKLNEEMAISAEEINVILDKKDN